MTQEPKFKLDMPFEEALERFASVNIKDITEIEGEISNGKKIKSLKRGSFFIG